MQSSFSFEVEAFVLDEVGLRRFRWRLKGAEEGERPSSESFATKREATHGRRDRPATCTATRPDLAMTNSAKPRPSLRELLSAKPDVSQSGARKLTDAEKATVREWADRREKERHPNAKITITVRDEVDADGNARYTALVLTEEVAEGLIV